MADEHRVVLIFGAGPNLGKAIASKFSASGYGVALAARSLSTGLASDGFLNVHADMSDPSAVPQVFQMTTDTFGPPNIVIYNGKL